MVDGNNSPRETAHRWERGEFAHVNHRVQVEIVAVEADR